MIIYSILSLLLSNSATLKQDRSILYSRVVIIILLYCIFITFCSLFIYKSLYKRIGLFGSLFHTISLIQIFLIFIFLLSAIILQLTAFYLRKILIKEYFSLSNIWTKFFYNKIEIINKIEQQLKIIEYLLIILFIIIKAIFLVSTSNIVAIFILIELQSYRLYLLLILYKNSELSTFARLTYFLLGGLSSCFILLGTSLLYANSDTTNLDGFYIITSLSNIVNQDYISNIIY